MISSTAPTGSPDGTGASENGTVFSAIRAIVPSARMKMMSSGLGVFFIQKFAFARRAALGRIRPEQHAPVGLQIGAVHQPAFLFRRGLRALDDEHDAGRSRF